MTDEAGNVQSHVPTELRPIIARLQEIRRKCASLGSRNEEAEQMSARLDSILAELTREPTEDDPAPSYAMLAQQLFPVARLFESSGFLSVAREVAHVEKALTALDPGFEPNPDGMEQVAAATDSDASDGRIVDRPGAVEPDDGSNPKRGGLPKPVALGLLVVLLAALIAIVAVRAQRAALERSDRELAAITPAANPTITPAPETTPRIAVQKVPATPTPGPRARLASLVGEARLAQRRGDIDGAISLLSQAAVIDKRATTVIETAGSVVSELISRSYGAADNAEWDEAAEDLERAREIAIRFELSTQPIDDAEDHHRRLVRYVKIDPEDATAIAENSGRRVVVIDVEGQRYEGRVHGAVGSVLELREGIDVGGDGTLFHVDEIPLARIREIRVYPD